jgi:hypothetical protein
MPRTIISKIKVLEVYKCAICVYDDKRDMYVIRGTKSLNQYQKTEGKAWENAYQKLRAEQRKSDGNAPKEITTIRIKPTVKTKIVEKHGSVQKWVDAITTAI